MSNRPPNQELIKRLMTEMEEQREIIERAKDARRIMRELNRMIAVLGGTPPPLPRNPRSGTRISPQPVVPPNEDGTYTCPECGRLFNRPQGLGVHRKTVHGVSGSKQPETGGEE